MVCENKLWLRIVAFIISFNSFAGFAFNPGVISKSESKIQIVFYNYPRTFDVHLSRVKKDIYKLKSLDLVKKYVEDSLKQYCSSNFTVIYKHVDSTTCHKMQCYRASTFDNSIITGSRDIPLIFNNLTEFDFFWGDTHLALDSFQINFNNPIFSDIKFSVPTNSESFGIIKNTYPNLFVKSLPSKNSNVQFEIIATQNGYSDTLKILFAGNDFKNKLDLMASELKAEGFSNNDISNIIVDYLKKDYNILKPTLDLYLKNKIK